MASGTINGGNVHGVYARVNWSSSAGTGGSSVSATLYWITVNGSFIATVNQGYSVTINGSTASGNTAGINGASAALISHSSWVSYTGNKSIGISGTFNAGNVWSYSAGAYLGTRSCSATVALDKVGSIPSVATVSAPTASTISETSTTISITWSKASSYSGSCSYYVDVSINGGAYTLIKDITNINTTSYSYTIPNKTQGTTYQFRVASHNDVGSAGHTYSGVVTLNKLSSPTIGTVNTYNPYLTATLTVPITGGSALNGQAITRRCELYHGTTVLASNASATVSNDNQSVAFTVTTAKYLECLGNTKVSDTFKLVAWLQNANGSKSATVEKTFTVNINSDGGATPTLAVPTFSGGYTGYTTTCFIAGVHTLGVTSATATGRRCLSTNTFTYRITANGVSKNGKSNTFSNLVAGIGTCTVTVTDSRGLTTTVTKQYRVQSYADPRIEINVASSGRLDSPNTTAKITYSLYYSNIYAYSSNVNTQGTQLNGISLQQYNLNGGSWINYTSGTTITNLSTEITYTVNLRIADRIKTTNYIQGSMLIPTIASGLSMRKWGIGIGCIPQDGNRLEVKGTSLFSGTVNIYSSNPLKFSTYGGTINMTDTSWIRFNKALYTASNVIRTDSYFENLGNSGTSWGSGLGRVKLWVNNTGSQNVLMSASTTTSGNARKYAIEALNSDSAPSLRLYAGTGYLQIRTGDLIYNGKHVLYATEIASW